MYNFKISGVHPLDRYVDYPVVITEIGEDPVTVKITPTWANGCICVSFKNGNSKLLDIRGWCCEISGNKTRHKTGYDVRLLLYLSLLVVL